MYKRGIANKDSHKVRNQQGGDQKINLLGPYVVELPPDVVWKITFEEQVTGINKNRLQEVVNKRLYLTVPVMTLIV